MNSLRGYSSLLGERGFDDMDEHILQDILFYKLGSADAEHLHSVFNTCASEADALLRRSGAEAGTADAFYVFVRTLRVMYRIGAAIQLTVMGYSFQKLNYV